MDLGFSCNKGSAHSARTIMLEDLTLLLSSVNSLKAAKADYRKAVNMDNCLRKRSAKTRRLAFRHLSRLYILDTSILIFRVLLYFWKRDISGRPLIALLCAYIRDPLLPLTAQFILKTPRGEFVSGKSIEVFIDSREPGRFSAATLKSTAQNLNSSWTKTGHLVGRVKKYRASAEPTSGSAAFALFLGYLKGYRGEVLFKSEFIKLLDCSFEKAVELAEDASQKGWIVLKRIGNVFEVLFPNLITREELEKIHEQN